MKQLFLIILTTITTIGLISCDKQTDNSSKENNKMSLDYSGDELKIIAEIYLKEDASSAMRPIFEKVIAGSQAEDGCVYYDLHQDIADTTNTKFMMIEVWKDQAAIDAHNNSQHFKTFVKVAQDYIDSMRVTTVKISK